MNDARDTLPDRQSTEDLRLLGFMAARIPARFQLLRLLGEGSMGHVFLAQDNVRGRLVALKVLRAELIGDANIEQRFRREATLLSALNHPNIVKVDFVHRTEPLCFSMDYVEGETLLEAVRLHGPIPYRRVLAIADRLLDALAAIHEQGIVHGDLKPENVFLRNFADVCLVDFGLAKLEGLTRLTRTGKFAGTVMYIAPELLTGLAEPSHRIDLYALGQCLFFALTGQHPFAVEKHPGAQMMLVARGKRAHSFPHDVPASLAAWVDRLSALDSNARFASAAAARESLAQLRLEVR